MIARGVTEMGGGILNVCGLEFYCLNSYVWINAACIRILRITKVKGFRYKVVQTYIKLNKFLN